MIPKPLTDLVEYFNINQYRRTEDAEAKPELVPVRDAMPRYKFHHTVAWLLMWLWDMFRSDQPEIVGPWYEDRLCEVEELTRLWPGLTEIVHVARLPADRGPGTPKNLPDYAIAIVDFNPALSLESRQEICRYLVENFKPVIER